MHFNRVALYYMYVYVVSRCIYGVSIVHILWLGAGRGRGTGVWLWFQLIIVINGLEYIRLKFMYCV
jgi:hypothetical protein